MHVAISGVAVGRIPEPEHRYGPHCLSVILSHYSTFCLLLYTSTHFASLSLDLVWSCSSTRGGDLSALEESGDPAFTAPGSGRLAGHSPPHTYTAARLCFSRYHSNDQSEKT